MKQTAYIALGSNVGDRVANLKQSLARIDARPETHVLEIATPIETEPVDCPAGSQPFLNSAAKLRVSLSPRDLLTWLLEVEQQLGRHRSAVNAPRTIDLDLLLYGNQVISDNDLVVPHPRMHERAFVLVPLAQIASEVVHPTMKKPIAVLLDELTR